jgi:tripartite-type tricarboxylate transporter receptor subunit TctC
MRQINARWSPTPAKRAALWIWCAALALGAAAAHAQQAYPTKPIRFMVGYPPGGGTDLTARLVAPRLADRLGQPVIVENRVGAAGNIAMEALAKSPPDGYTVAVGVSGLTINATLQPNLPFDPARDFSPVIKLVNNPLVLVANPKFPAREMRDLIGMAKTQPGKIAYGSAGNGTAMHLVGELLNQGAGIELVHVPYKGNGPMVNDVLGGQIPLAISDVASTLSFIKAGRLKVIGIANPTRSAVAPDMPTLAETGMPGFGVLSWTSVIAPARVPAAIVGRLNSGIRAILETPEVRDGLIAVGLEPAPTTPEELGEIIRTETARWAKVIKTAGITSDP